MVSLPIFSVKKKMHISKNELKMAEIIDVFCSVSFAPPRPIPKNAFFSPPTISFQNKPIKKASGQKPLV
jgi:hypothetical protein